MSLNESSFSINVTTDSGENYAGTFTCRRRLSHLQNLKKDELRRTLLGSHPDQAPDLVKQNAFILSTVAAYIVEGPRWWSESNFGQDLFDESPVAAVFEQISMVIKTVNDELEAKAKKAQESLKTA